MGKRLDITGQRFGRLVAIRPVERKNSNLTYWLCKCDCGKEKEISLGSLRRGNSKSCGCWHNEMVGQISANRKTYNEYEVIGDTVYVKMIHSNTLICDLDDWERLKEIKWSANKRGYVTGRNINTKRNVKFHQEVMGKHDGFVIDHINGNTLDNRKCNLRVVTQTMNMWNRKIPKSNKSGVLGVYQSHGKWVASIGLNRKRIHLGTFETLEEAKKVRKEAETKYFNFTN